MISVAFSNYFLKKKFYMVIFLEIFRAVCHDASRPGVICRCCCSPNDGASFGGGNIIVLWNF